MLKKKKKDLQQSAREIMLTWTNVVVVEVMRSGQILNMGISPWNISNLFHESWTFCLESLT